MKRNLKITILDFDDIKNPLLSGGQARATVEVGSRLIKRGHKITVLCSRYPGYKDRTEKGIFYKHIGLGSKNIRLNNLFYILALPFALKNIRTDIIIECFTAPVSTLFSPLFTNIPVVAIPTSFEADRFAKLYHLPFNLIEKTGLKFYKYFMPYTKDLDQKMKSVNPDVTSVIIPEGVGQEFFKIKQVKPKHILFLGRFDVGQKGIDLLLESFSKVAAQIDYPLVLAGFGPDEQQVKNLIKKYGLESKVKLVGPAYKAKKFKLLSEALFVAFPSRHEGFSLFALEALASGLPLIGFDIPGLSWTDKKVSLKAKVFNISEYARILKTASDAKIIGEMRREARPFAKKYTWENVALMQEKFFYQVLKKEAQQV